MAEFTNIKVGEEVFSLVYGVGRVRYKIPKNSTISGFYSFEVEYNTGQRIYYTDEGIPNWCNNPENCKTLWYKKDIDIADLDIVPTAEVLSLKKIIKLRAKGKLEIKCPSGIWRNVEGCPEREIMDALANEHYHLFKEEEKK